MLAALAAIEALQAQGRARPRIVGLIETGEESGSPDLLPTLQALRSRLGIVGLVICLDSGAGNYDQLWLTTSLRGLVSGVLRVDILTEGVHCGDASGVVPSSFRILRHVLEGMPSLRDAGHVLRPYTAFKLSLRLPPLVDAAQAAEQLKTLREDNAPYRARVTFEPDSARLTAGTRRPPRRGSSRRCRWPARRTLARPAPPSAKGARSR